MGKERWRNAFDLLTKDLGQVHGHLRKSLRRTVGEWLSAMLRKTTWTCKILTKVSRATSVKVVKKPRYTIKTSTMNFTKSLPISLRHGISVPQYGESDSTEQTRGTINSASRARTSNDSPIRSSSCLERPTTPFAALA